MGLLLAAVGGDQVDAVSFARPGQRVHHFGDRGDPSLVYRPDPTEQGIFRRSELVLTAGRSDLWALSGLSEELTTAAVGPTIRLDRLPAAEIHRSGAGGAPWLDPLILAEAAAEIDRRLDAIFAEPSTARSERAAEIERRLRSLVESRQARFSRVMTLSSEPLALLRRFEIEAVTLLPDRTQLLPALDEMRETIDRERPEALLLPTDWAAETADEWSAQLGLPVVLYDPTGTTIAEDLPPAEEKGAGVGVEMPSGRVARDLLVEWVRFNVESLTVTRSAGGAG